MKSWRLWKRTRIIGDYSKLSFFNNECWIGHLWKVSRDFVRYLKLSEIEAHKRNYFMLKPQVKCKNICAVNHQWSKLSFFIKGYWFGDVWKVSNYCDAIWWLSESTKLLQRRSLKAISGKCWRLCKHTRMIGVQSKLICFLKQRLIRSFIQSFKQFRDNVQTSKVLAHKRRWYKLEPGFKFKNLSLVNQQWRKLSFFIKGWWFGDVWKVSNDCDVISQLSEPTKLLQKRSLIAI